jgi:hypothetical protein
MKPSAINIVFTSLTSWRPKEQGAK